MTKSQSTVFAHQRQPNRLVPPRDHRRVIANAHHRNDVQHANDRQLQKNVIGEWKRFILDLMTTDQEGSYHPFCLNNITEDRTATYARPQS
jgi:hypothetical protein